MLVVQRKCDETVKLYDRASGAIMGTLTVTEIKGGRVKLGFDAGDDVVILRGELARESRPVEEPAASDDGSRDLDCPDRESAA